MLSTKENVSKLSILAIAALIIVKVIAGILTGSIAILADAVHSVIDLTGVIIGYIGIKISDKPADEEHTFGHGKAENIAGAIIACLIFAAGGVIFYQAVRNIINGAEVEMVTAGIVITAVAILINILMSRYALRVAHDTDSLALEATARDMLADVMSSGAVLIGLVLVRITGNEILDPIVAMIVAVLIVVTASFTIRKSVSGLMDRTLPQAEVDEILATIREHTAQVAGFHKVRTRKAGNQRFIDFHLMLPGNISVDEAHSMCDHLEQDIKAKLPGSNVTIHVEPCTGECEECLMDSCSQRTDKEPGSDTR